LGCGPGILPSPPEPGMVPGVPLAAPVPVASVAARSRRPAAICVADAGLAVG